MPRAIACVLVAAVLAGCGGAETERDTETETETDTETRSATQAAEGLARCAPDEPDGAAQWYVDHLREPPEGHPSFATLGDEQLLAIGRFLDASRGC